MNRTQLSQLAVLAAVAAHGSFRGAARELGVAPSAVSHAVGSLEASLGIRLLARTTRSVAPTEEGRRLLERLAPALQEIAHALEAAADARERPAGNLRITAPRFAADRLQGRLLLLHGTMDDNVHVQNSLQFAYELQRAGKPFDMMLYPRSRHGISDPRLNFHVRQLMYDFVMRIAQGR